MRLIHTTDKDLQALQRNVVEEAGSIRREIVARRAGLSTKIITKDSGVAFGQIARVSPLNGPINIHLPKIGPGDVGKTLMLLNDSISDNDIVVYTVPPDTLETLGSFTMEGAGSRVTLCAIDVGRWAFIGDARVNIDAAEVDRYLMLSDDTELTETSTSYVAKKEFRVVVDSGKVPTKWRFVLSVWIDGGSGGDTLSVKTKVGTDETETTGIAIGGGEAIIYLNTPATGTQATAGSAFATASVWLKVVGAGGATGHLKYTDLYAVFE